MRQKRAKAYKKLMATYERSFGFRHPYQVLITADFLEDANGFKLDALAGLTRTLQGTIKPMITQCCIKTLYDIGNAAAGSTYLAKTFERRRCGHVETPESPAACLSEMIGVRNKHRYIVATQDRGLRNTLRDIPGVPLVYINRSVMILEPPSRATLDIKVRGEKEKMGLTKDEIKVLKKRIPISSKDGKSGNVVTESSGIGALDEGADEGVDGPQEQPDRPKRKRKRGPKEPNPLSIKKPKTVKIPVGGHVLDPMREAAIKKAEEVRPTLPVHTRTRRKRKHAKTSDEAEKSKKLKESPEMTDD